MKTTALTLALASLLTLGTSVAGDWTWKRPAKNLIPLEPPVVDCCLSYDYIDLEYFKTDFGSPYYYNGDNFGFGFSKSLGHTFFVNGGIAGGEYDFDWFDHIVPVETKRYRLGLGARAGIAKCIDLTFEGGFEHFDSEYPGNEAKDFDSWGYYFGPGVRAQVGNFEFFAKAFYFGREGDYSQQYLSMNSSYYGRVDEYGWVFTPGVVLHLTDHLGLKLAAEIEEHDTDLIAGVRYHF